MKLTAKHVIINQSSVAIGSAMISIIIASIIGVDNCERILWNSLHSMQMEPIGEEVNK